MSHFALAAFAGGCAWVAARLAVAQFVDEEIDRHGWTSAAGDQSWSSGRSAQASGHIVLDLQPRPSRIYSAA